LKAWYKHAGGRTSHPSKIDIQKLQTEYDELLANKPCAEPPIPVLVVPFDVDDATLSEQEIGKAVGRLHIDRSPGPSGMSSENLKEWRDAAWRKESPDSTKCDVVVVLIQHIFKSGNIPTELPWSVLVAIPKPSRGFCEIGLLKVIWKTISSIIDSRIKEKVKFHPELHGFRPGRGTGSATIESKLCIQLATIHQIPLYAICLDLHRAYDTLHRGRTLDIMRGYGVGPKVLRLLQNFWDSQRMVVQQGEYHSRHFSVDRGITQGDIPSPTIVNMVVDSIVRYWTAEVLQDQYPAINGDPGWLEILALFYADDGLLTSQEAQKVQLSTDFLVEMFCKVNLEANIKKLKTMVCLPNSVQGHISGPAYDRRILCEGETYKARKRRRIQCPRCEKYLAYGSLSNHLLRLHGKQLRIMELSNSPHISPPLKYQVSFPLYCQSIACPVEGCTGKASTRANLWSHFMYKHLEDDIVMMEEGALPICLYCGMITSYSSLASRHKNVWQYKQGKEIKHKCSITLEAQRALQVVFNINDNPIESDNTFK
jgi:hypothetical protein